MTTLLLIGGTHPRYRAKFDDTYTLIELPNGDVANITAEMAQTVEGLATFGSANAALMDALPKLKIIAGFGAGYEGIDVAHAASKNIIVTNTSEALNDEVADTAVALLINTVRQLPKSEAWLRAGGWTAGGSYPVTPLTLRGRHAGIYGMGKIGKMVAQRLEAFNIRVSYHGRNRQDGLHYDYHPSLASLAEATDTLICIVPKTPQTHHVINAEIFEKLGPSGVLINVGRGWSVSEPDLIAALQNGTIAGAGLDVFEDEPNVPGALYGFDNVSLLPHVASGSVYTRNAMADLAADNLISYFTQGRPLTPVSETPFTG
ncbi:MAG: 2-hydroxyacid dehydrogenase [Rhodobacteraceae bacterium]|nr:2-hydroxyacid dehydrogenase [Paracoccaceae bacterium]